ncbi:MAG: hypothetical protein A2W25_11845 [candidate division Zixibacteria bacterium RBG_16_53_22]|nr:MAG: hypothetical protein A2W25_11845 [candidate division Zixibacteria bacterium RBG_16_53_22]
MDWKYLQSEPFQLRYVLAAYLVRYCMDVIEIGGCEIPIHVFMDLRNHGSITVVDPRMKTGFTIDNKRQIASVVHINKPIQECHFPYSEFGLVILGMHIQGDLEPVFDLVKRSKVTVIDFSLDFKPSVDQFNQMLQATQRPIRMQFKLDLTGNDFGDLTDSWPARPIRQMYVL